MHCSVLRIGLCRGNRGQAAAFKALKVQCFVSCPGAFLHVARNWGIWELNHQHWGSHVTALDKKQHDQRKYLDQSEESYVNRV